MAITRVMSEREPPFLVFVADLSTAPERGKGLSNVLQLLAHLYCERWEHAMTLHTLCFFFHLSYRHQIFLPAVFEFGGHEPIFRINRLIASACQVRLIPCTAHLVAPVLSDALFLLLTLGEQRLQRIKLGWLQSLKEGLDDDLLNGRPIHRHAAFPGTVPFQAVAAVADTGFVGDAHAIATTATANQALQQGFSLSRSASGLLLVRCFGVYHPCIVGEPRLILLLLLPTDVGRIHAVLNGGPFLHRLTDDS